MKVDENGEFLAPRWKESCDSLEKKNKIQYKK